MKTLNICFQYMNYENIKIFVCNTLIMKIGKYLQYMNYENMKRFVCNTWIMKTWKCPFETHEFETHEFETWITKTGQ